MNRYWEGWWIFCTAIAVCAVFASGCVTATEGQQSITVPAPNGSPQFVRRTPVLSAQNTEREFADTLAEVTDIFIADILLSSLTEEANENQSPVDLGANATDVRTDPPAVALSTTTQSASPADVDDFTPLPLLEVQSAQREQPAAAENDIPTRSAETNNVTQPNIVLQTPPSTTPDTQPAVITDIDTQSTTQDSVVTPSPLDDSLAGVLSLLSQGFVSQGLQELRTFDLAQPAAPELVSTIAAYAVAAQQPLLAIQLYKKNIAAPAPFDEEATLALIELEFRMGNLNNVRDYVNHALQRDYVPHAEALIELANNALQTEQYDETERLLDVFATHFLSSELHDQYLWLQGQLFEQNRARRDIPAAIVHYTRLTELYPFSMYWESARVRARYLQRHFVNLQ